MATTSMMDMTDRMNLHRSGAANNLFLEKKKVIIREKIFMQREKVFMHRENLPDAYLN